MLPPGHFCFKKFPKKNLKLHKQYLVFLLNWWEGVARGNLNKTEKAKTETTTAWELITLAWGSLSTKNQILPRTTLNKFSKTAFMNMLSITSNHQFIFTNLLLFSYEIWCCDFFNIVVNCILRHLHDLEKFGWFQYKVYRAIYFFI